MKRIVLSPKAKSDLNNIWDYTEETWSDKKAEGYIRELRKSLQLLADNPSLASNADYIRKDYRKALSGSHVIYLKQIENGIDVIRILHERMDFKGRV